jgi:hypothetical protein
MKTRLVVSLALALLGPLPASAQISKALQDKIDAKAPRGYDEQTHETGPFPRRGDVEHQFQLEPEYEYVVLAVCGDECDETSPSISVPKGNDEDDQWGRPEGGGVYRIKSRADPFSVRVKVGLPKCSKSPCEYAIALFKKRVP